MVGFGGRAQLGLGYEAIFEGWSSQTRDSTKASKLPEKVIYVNCKLSHKGYERMKQQSTQWSSNCGQGRVLQQSRPCVEAA